MLGTIPPSCLQDIEATATIVLSMPLCSSDSGINLHAPKKSTETKVSTCSLQVSGWSIIVDARFYTYCLLVYKMLTPHHSSSSSSSNDDASFCFASIAHATVLTLYVLYYLTKSFTVSLRIAQLVEHLTVDVFFKPLCRYQNVSGSIPLSERFRIFLDFTNWTNWNMMVWIIDNTDRPYIGISKI